MALVINLWSAPNFFVSGGCVIAGVKHKWSEYIIASLPPTVFQRC
jgi:hypothetical protein